MKTIKPEDFNKLEDPEEILDFLKKVGAEKEEKKNPRENYLYKGLYTDESVNCEIIGYNGNYEVIIRMESGELHCIHPSYLVEMQSSKFGLD